MSGKNTKNEAGDARPTCKYGTKCYRKNPAHFEEYRHPGYDSDTDDDSEELEKSPPAKRQKLESIASTSGSSSPSSSTGKMNDSCVPFLLTTVRGISSEFNARNMAIGIKGTI